MCGAIKRFCNSFQQGLVKLYINFYWFKGFYPLPKVKPIFFRVFKQGFRLANTRLGKPYFNADWFIHLCPLSKVRLKKNIRKPPIFLTVIRQGLKLAET